MFSSGGAAGTGLDGEVDGRDAAADSGSAIAAMGKGDGNGDGDDDGETE